MSTAKLKYDDLNWVLSALQMMIDETMYHMQTFAHTLEAHHNKKASEIFSFFYQQVKSEQEMIQSYIGTKDLPSIAPWETVYPGYKHPSEVLSEFLLEESQNNELLNLIQELLTHTQRSKITNQKKVFNLLDQDIERDDDLDLISSEDFKGSFQ